jgi:hypothetical protein
VFDHQGDEQRGKTVPHRPAGNSVTNCCHGPTKGSQHKKATNAVLTFKREWGVRGIMGRAAGLMTAGLGTYMTFKMWAEFNDALGSVFGASWGIIIATVVFLIYQSNKNEKDYEASFGESIPKAISKGQMDSDNPQPLVFIAGLYVFIIVIFEILLSAI